MGKAWRNAGSASGEVELRRLFILLFLSATPAIASEGNAKDRFLSCHAKAMRTVIVAAGRFDPKIVTERTLAFCAYQLIDYRTSYGEERAVETFKEGLRFGQQQFDKFGTNALSVYDQFDDNGRLIPVE